MGRVFLKYGVGGLFKDERSHTLCCTSIYFQRKCYVRVVTLVLIVVGCGSCVYLV